jgi:hypothetical protein
MSKSAVRGACNLVSAFRVAPRPISWFGCGALLSAITYRPVVTLFHFFRKLLRIFRASAKNWKKVHAECIFLQALRVSAQLLKLTCQLNRLIPIEEQIFLVVSDDPCALVALTSIAGSFKRLTQYAVGGRVEGYADYRSVDVRLRNVETIRLSRVCICLFNRWHWTHWTAESNQIVV